jgi:hypothetical protein
MAVEDVTRNYLLFVVLPLWVLVAAADYLCHRASAIERTSGLRETALHFLLLGEAGVAVLAGLFLEINALVLLFMLLALVVHELTAYWDVAYAATRREITPLEQRVHDYLGTIPFMAFSFVLVLHWDAAMLAFVTPADAANWSIALKQTPLPAGYVASLLAAILLFDLLPYLEELLRDLRWKTKRAKPEPGE